MACFCTCCKIGKFDLNINFYLRRGQ
uniref:Uncharacterized protein n=1 Tax=Anguilla anguilla TaxID=7936 RepID=A0A0E9VTJ9_ANGAN